MPVNVSTRVEAVPASPIRKLVPLADAAKERGVHVYHLNIGQPDVRTPDELWDAIKNYNEPVLAYGPSTGLPKLREGLAKYYANFGVNVTPEEVIVTSGGSEALLFALFIVANPGDEVLVFEPFYANYNGFGAAAGVKVVPVTASPDDGYRLPSLATIEAKITSKTRAILFCNPGNPTGVVYTREELQRLITLAKKHDLFLVADEVYREFAYDGAEYISMMTFPEVADRVILADSISKRFSACGARIGNIVSHNKDVMAAALRLGQARLCPPTIEQVGAIGALKVPHAYYEAVKKEYQHRRDVCMEGLAAIPGARAPKPAGAFYIFAELPIDDANEFAKFMLNDFNVNGSTTMVAPGDGFYGTPGAGKKEIRLAYVLNENDLRAAMAILKQGVAAYQQTRMGVTAK